MDKHAMRCFHRLMYAITGAISDGTLSTATDLGQPAAHHRTPKQCSPEPLEVTSHCEGDGMAQRYLDVT
jgi:hypothetical protein